MIATVQHTNEGYAMVKKTVQTLHNGKLPMDANINMLMLNMGIPTSAPNPYKSPRRTTTSAASEREALETIGAGINTMGKPQDNNTKKVNVVSPPLTQPPYQHHNDNKLYGGG